MKLHEMETAIQNDEFEEDETVCEYVPSGEAEDEDVKLEAWTDKILCHLFGADHNKSVKKGRKGVKKILSKALGEVEALDNDLAESLDLLDQSLTLLERVLSRHPHTSLNRELVEHMEECSDWLSNWGMHQDPAISDTKKT